LDALDPAKYPKTATQRALLDLLVHKFAPKPRSPGNQRTPACDIVDMLWEAFNEHLPKKSKRVFCDLLVAISGIYAVDLGGPDYQLKRIDERRRTSSKAFDQFVIDIVNGRVPEAIEREVRPDLIPSLMRALQEEDVRGFHKKQ
jgi:hypothetical protein